MHFIPVAVFGLWLAAAPAARAQGEVAKNKNPFPVKYVSEADQKILLKTLTLAPVYDNVNGIYAGPVEKLLTDMLQSDKVWGYTAFPDLNRKIFIEQFDSEPALVLEALSKANAQGLLTAFITKGSKGLTARLKLFTQDQGLILLEESFQDQEAFEVSTLRARFAEMYRDIKNRLPYRGYVLSRRGLDVTLNLGSVNGVKAGQELTLAQILKVNRHPKLKTMVGVEKEIIAKAKVTKVEEYLSFARITFEKETGVVEVGTKVLPTDFISYPLPKISAAGDVTGDIPATASRQTAAPAEEPTGDSDGETGAVAGGPEQKIGVVIAQGVFSYVKDSTELRSGGNYQLSKGWTPGFYLGARFYYTEGLFIDFNTQYTSFTTDNPLANSLARELSYSYHRLSGAAGYDFVLPSGIVLTPAVGFSSYRTEVSDSSPTAVTNADISAAALQLKAAVPVQPLTLGVIMDFAFAKKYSESPVDSGDSSTSVTNIGVFGSYPFTESLSGRVDVAMNKISMEFSGTPTNPTTPATSKTIELVNLQAGVEYTF